MNMVGLPPGMIITLSGETSTLKRFARSAATASRRGGIPFAGVYPWWPSRSALTAASTIKSGVRKSGCPMPRLMMSRPCAASALARASTAKAFSSPMRSKAAIVRSMIAILPPGCRSQGYPRRLLNEGSSSADQAEKIKRRQGLRPSAFSKFATQTAAYVAQYLEADIGIRVVSEVDVAKIQRPGRHQIRPPMIGIGPHGFGCRRDFLVLTHFLGVLGIRRCGKCKSGNKYSNENFERQRRHGGLRKNSAASCLANYRERAK